MLLRLSKAMLRYRGKKRTYSANSILMTISVSEQESQIKKFDGHRKVMSLVCHVTNELTQSTISNQAYSYSHTSLVQGWQVHSVPPMTGKDWRMMCEDNGDPRHDARQILIQRKNSADTNITPRKRHMRHRASVVTGFRLSDAPTSLRRADPVINNDIWQ